VGADVGLAPELAEQHELNATAGGLLLCPANAEDSFSQRSPAGCQVELTDAGPCCPGVTSINVAGAAPAKRGQQGRRDR
jgi:hypothetical protein